MNLMGLTSLLLSVCTATAPLEAGKPAPCSGLLWSPQQTREAVKCRQVELPTALADLGLCQETKRIEIHRLKEKLRIAEEQIDQTPDPLAPWVIPSVAAGSFIIGAVVMSMTVSFR